MMQTSHFNEEWFKRLEDCGVLRNEFSSLGWALWPKDQNNQQMGFFDEGSLRALADEIERRNKPFWDEYNKYCEEHQEEILGDSVEEVILPNTDE